MGSRSTRSRDDLKGGVAAALDPRGKVVRMYAGRLAAQEQDGQRIIPVAEAAELAERDSKLEGDFFESQQFHVVMRHLARRQSVRGISPFSFGAASE